MIPTAYTEAVEPQRSLLEQQLVRLQLGVIFAFSFILPYLSKRFPINHFITAVMSSIAKNNKDIFTLFDKKGQGSISKQQFGDYLRAIGYNPTNAQVAEILSASSDDTLTLEQISSLIDANQELLDATTTGKIEDFIKAFQVFDKENTGKVTVGDIRYMLTGLGEKLSDEEVDELLKGVEIDADGGIDYKKFMEDILRQ